MSMQETYQIGNVPLVHPTKDEYQDFLRNALRGTGVSTIHTVNPEMLIDANAHAVFARTLASATVCVPDGVGIRYACLALYNAAIEVHPGIDTVLELMDLTHTEHVRIAVCGARPKEHEAFRVLLAKRSPAAELLCIDPGIIDERDPHLPSPSVERLLAFAPHIVLVALGQGRGVRQGKQEYIVQELAQKLPSARIIIGVGGALDVLGGRITRAPSWMRMRNLEWLYRLILQPWRFQRICKAFIMFPAFIVWETIKKRIFLQATTRVLRQVGRDITQHSKNHVS